MTVLALGFGLIVGLLVGRLFRDNETCPRRVLDYNCRGLTCDHRKSLLYANMSAMAKNKEDQAPNIPGSF